MADTNKTATREFDISEDRRIKLACTKTIDGYEWSAELLDGDGESLKKISPEGQEKFLPVIIMYPHKWFPEGQKYTFPDGPKGVEGSDMNLLVQYIKEIAVELNATVPTI